MRGYLCSNCQTLDCTKNLFVTPCEWALFSNPVWPYSFEAFPTLLNLTKPKTNRENTLLFAVQLSQSFFFLYNLYPKWNCIQHFLIKLIYLICRIKLLILVSVRPESLRSILAQLYQRFIKLNYRVAHSGEKRRRIYKEFVSLLQSGIG